MPSCAETSFGREPTPSADEISQRLSTIPDKRVGTRSKFSPPPTFNVDNQVIFALSVGKNALFSNID